MKSDIKKRKSMNIMLKYVDEFHYRDNNVDFLEITEWINGEGYDVTLRDQKFDFTREEFDAMKSLMWCIENNINLIPEENETR